MLMLYDGEVQIFWSLSGSDNNNAYLIISPETDESIIIDAPVGLGELLEVAKSTRVKAVLITHNHRDHLDGLEAIIEATGAPVGIHGEDASRIPVVPDILVKDGDRIIVGSIEVEVLHTPGHTMGSVCYLVGKHLFSGDTLFARGVGSTGSVEELQLLYKSITEKLYVLEDGIFLLPGHGKGSIMGVEKKVYREFVAKYPDILPPIPEMPPTSLSV